MVHIPYERNECVRKNTHMRVNRRTGREGEEDRSIDPQRGSRP